MTQSPSSNAPVPPIGETRLPTNGPAGGSTKLLIVAAALAVAAVVLVNLYVEAAKRSVDTDEFPVFRMRVSKSPGQTLEARDIERIAVPEKFETSFAGAVASNAQGQPDNIGEVFTRPIEPNEILEYRHFDLLNDDESRLLINRNMRGIALPVDSSTLPDPLRPEMWVDLEAPFTGPAGDIVFMPVMERVRIVSVGSTNIIDEQRGSRGRSGAGKITLEVTPEQASQLESIQTIVTGSFRVHLRRADDLNRPKIPEGGINPAVLAKLSEY